MEVNGQLHVPSALPSGKLPPVRIGYEAGWAPEFVWTLWRRANSCIAGNWTRADQHIARCHKMKTELNLMDTSYIEIQHIWFNILHAGFEQPSHEMKQITILYT
jgi:hypothetical protein